MVAINQLGNHVFTLAQQPSWLAVIHAALHNFFLQFLGLSHGWVRAFSSLIGTLLAVFVGINFKGIYSGSNLFVTVEKIWPAFVAPHLLWVSHLCFLSCLGFTLYTGALWFVDTSEVVLCYLNQYLVVQPPCYTSPSSASTGY